MVEAPEHPSSLVRRVKTSLPLFGGQDSPGWVWGGSHGHGCSGNTIPIPPGNPKGGLWVWWWWETGLGREPPFRGGPRGCEREEKEPQSRSLAEPGCLWSLARGSRGRVRGHGVLGTGSQGGGVSGGTGGTGVGLMPRAFMYERSWSGISARTSRASPAMLSPAPGPPDM